MTSLRFRSAFLILLLLPCSPAFSQASPPVPQSYPSAALPSLSDPATEKKIDALLQKMTLEEKVGQLVQYSAGQGAGPGAGRSDYDSMIRNGEVGALFNVITAHGVNAYQRVAVEQSRLHIPLLFGLDVIHGFRTELPIPLALASTWDTHLVEGAARVAARETSATGIRWTFSPMVDISRDARWGRMTESSGEDPYLGSEMARAYVRGYQGARLDSPDSVAACPKHFVGYGGAEGGRDYNSTEISEHTLREFYLPPFRAALEAGAPTIMAGFNSLNAVPSSANPFTLTQILRREWGFQGIADSDWTSVGELVPHGIANDSATAAKKALLAGLDMDMVSSFYHDNLASLVRGGQVPQSAVDEAVRRVLRVKFALGLFDHPYADEKQEASAMLRPESLDLARKAAEGSFVLLKNTGVSGGSPILPLSAKVGTIALIGPLADDAAQMLGAWAGQGRAEDVLTLHAALTQKLGADHVHHAKGSEIVGGSDEQQSEAVAAAQHSDVVVMALGENASQMTGEAASRAHLGLPGRQQQLLEAIVATGKPVVLVLFSGRPLTLPWTFKNVTAVLAAWFPGLQAGPALVHTLFGESDPEGRLVVSWPRAAGQEPLYYNHLNTGRPSGAIDLSHPPKDGEKFFSRYIDEENSPQFPFGYGLTYTTFRYGATRAKSKQLSAGTLNRELQKRPSNSAGALSVSAEVTNSGSRAGDTIAEVYIRLRGTSTAQPIRALKGWQRVKLAPGETRTITFDLPAEAFAIWGDQNQFAVEPAELTVWVSLDSATGEGASIQITP